MAKKTKKPLVVEAEPAMVEVKEVIPPKANVVVKSLTDFHKEGGLRWTVGQVRTIQRPLYEHYLTIGGKFEIIREED